MAANPKAEICAFKDGTWFGIVAPEIDIFLKILDKFFQGERDKRTLELVK